MYIYNTLNNSVWMHMLTGGLACLCVYIYIHTHNQALMIIFYLLVG